MAKSVRNVMSRRAVLRGGAIAGVGVAAAALLGCRSNGTPTASQAPSPETANELKKRIEAIQGKYPGTFQDPPGVQPKRGGSLTRLIAQDVGSFDTTKSGASGNLSHTN